MRNAFAAEITTLGAADPRVVVLSGDIGNRLFDPFRDRNPARFINCGIAEANMMGVAAGLALSGFRPFVYTIAPFTTTRCLEQIRIDACYHKAPVVIVGTGAGLSYAELGATHHSCEDIAVLRVLADMTVICPCDAVELRLAMQAALHHNGPIYIRIGKKGEPVIHQTPPAFTIGRSITVRSGNDVCFLSTGNIMPVVLEAAERLQALGVSARVESVHTVKPLDTECLSSVFASHRLVATVEEHSRIGGLGAAVAEWRATQRSSVGLLRAFAVPDEFLHECGSQDYARRRYGLTAETLAAQVQAELEG